MANLIEMELDGHCPGFSVIITKGMVKHAIAALFFENKMALVSQTRHGRGILFLYCKDIFAWQRARKLQTLLFACECDYYITSSKNKPHGLCWQECTGKKESKIAALTSEYSLL